MHVRDRMIERRLLLGALVCAFLFIIIYSALVSTAWGHQFDDDAFLSRTLLNHKFIRLNFHLLDLFRRSTLLLVILLILGIGMVRRCTLAGAVAAVAFGGAVFGAELFKSVLPWQEMIPDDGLLGIGFYTNTFPSGHATAATSLTLSLILVSASRWRLPLAIAGGCLTAVFATGVFFVGWHRPSDALGALAWSGLCMSLAAAVVVRMRGKPRSALNLQGTGVRFRSIVTGIFAVAAACLISAAAASQDLLNDAPFFLVTGLIIGGAFALIAWYGWQLRAVDWPEVSRKGTPRYAKEF